jgi:alkylation response protein AidB-like acyl-CoA dehydrogenase
MADFFQTGPTLKNQYTDDRFLRSYLKRRLPASVLQDIEPGLVGLGERAVTDILAAARECELQEPVHVPYDPWGRRVDDIVCAPGWKKLDRIAAEEGIVATAYERAHGEWSRLHQFARLYLYAPSSAIYACPLAMTDGAARAIELFGDQHLKETTFRRLTSRVPEFFWTSGQWMTEREGGSDVGNSSTVAKFVDGEFRLHGAKFFTSAITAQMAMTLARVEGAPGGSRGLSFFYLETRDKAGRLNNIRINRLKDKLGTRALPTAELELLGTPARMMGGDGQGVKKITTLFNITRSVAGMRRGLALARDYAGKRSVFGKLLADQPLHVETLADLEAEYQAMLLLTFHLADLLGKDEVGVATADETAILRMLTPIAKLYTAKAAVANASEIVESFGGAGYMEDTGIPVLLRDAQTLTIWEGTTNVLSLDTLRAITKDGTFEPFLADLRKRLDGIRVAELNGAVAKTRAAADTVAGFLPRALAEGIDYAQAGARGFAYALARTYAATLLLEHAQWSLENERDRRGVAAALRYCRQDLAPLSDPLADLRHDAKALAMDTEVI